LRNRSALVGVVAILVGVAHAQEEVIVDQNRRVLPLVLQLESMDDLCAVGQECWVEVVYRAAPMGRELHVEPGERVWWLGELPLVVLGASGLPLPRSVTQRAQAYAEIWIDGMAIMERPLSLRPARDAISVYAQPESMTRALKASLGLNLEASYLAQVVNFMVGNVDTLAINGTSYQLDGQPIISGDGLNLEGQLLGPTAIPQEGPGTRMMWYPAKGAFRAGTVTGGSWDDSFIGINSVAFGSDNSAGDNSFAFGTENDAGDDSMSGGIDCNAYSNSFAFGDHTSANSNGFAAGSFCYALGSHNTALGYFCTADGEYGVSLGFGCFTQGTASVALGADAEALHDGTYVWCDLASGTFTSTGMNQYLVQASGGVGIGTDQPAAQLHIDDAISLDPFRVDISGTRHLQLRNDGRLVVGTGDPNPGSVDALNVEVPADTDAVRVRLGGNTKFRIHNNGGCSIGVNSLPTADGLLVQGNISKGGGSFKIDHPLDPQNKYLYHSFVESPDMMNIYNGRIELDERGEAVVSLPDYFEALNRDYRYQLTPIGAPSLLYIAEEVSDGRFTIAGGRPGQIVCWSVTGIRKDAYANAHRIPVEEPKPQTERGTYLHPKAFGVSEDHRSELND